MANWRVLIVDERRLLGAILAEVISAEDAALEARVLRELSTLPTALASGWDVVIASEAYAPPVLRLSDPSTRVLVLVQSVRIPAVALLLRQGAAGVCTPQDSPQDVLAAVRQVADKGMRLPTDVVAPVLLELERLRAVADDADRVLSLLTEREREVLAGLGRGRGRAEIGQDLNLSPHTVRTHIQHLLRKLSLHSQLEAGAFARELGAALGRDVQDSDSGRVLDLRDPPQSRSRSDSARGVD